MQSNLQALSLKELRKIDLMQLIKLIEDNFNVKERDQIISLEDFEYIATKCCGFYDDERISTLGGSLIFLLTYYPQHRGPDFIEHILFNLSPEKEPFCDDIIDVDKDLEKEQIKFLNKFSQAQAKLIFTAFLIIFDKYQYNFSTDEIIAFSIYWYNKSKNIENYEF